MQILVGGYICGYRKNWPAEEMAISHKDTNFVFYFYVEVIQVYCIFRATNLVRATFELINKKIHPFGKIHSVWLDELCANRRRAIRAVAYIVWSEARQWTVVPAL